jgi:hypothetical protein
MHNELDTAATVFSAWGNDTDKKSAKAVYLGRITAEKNVTGHSYSGKLEFNCFFIYV